jgi:molybdopterin molybdotransferase
MDESDPNSLSVAEALARIEKSIVSLDRSESLSISGFLDRILAEDIRSPIDVPPYTNSAMDGYAIDGTSLPLEKEKAYSLAGTVLAGTPLKQSVPVDHCARIMTGGKMPEGTDTVIMQEHVRVKNDRIFIGANHQRGQNVRQAGEDIKQGQTVLKEGKRLTSADIGVLASLGISQVQARPLLNVAIYSTGDELVPLGTELRPGQIYDSNRYTLIAMLKRFGANILDSGVIKDNRKAIENAFSDAADNADVLITTGGVSVGDADYVKDTLEKIGEINFWKIAMKPGRPLAFGKIKQCHFFGLPGNPVSTMVTFYQFVIPALKKLQGETGGPKITLSMRCTTPIRKNVGRSEFQRGIMEYDTNGELTVRSTGGQGSHMLSSMATANCFIILPLECKGVNAGEMVEVQPFAGII